MLGDEDGAAAGLWAMANLATPMAVRVAATLRIADHLTAGPRTAADLARAMRADPHALERLMRYLSVRGVFSRNEYGQYSLTARGEPLRSDHPAEIRAWLDIECGGRGELSLVELLHSIRTGKAAFPELYGRSFWDDLAAEPGRWPAYNALFGAHATERAPGIVYGFDWGSLGRVVDVGGGDGSLLIEMLRAYPDLHGTIVELPEVAETARKALTAAGMAHRSDVVVGDFLDPLPAGAGGYLLSLILHNWDDEHARMILRRCAEAADSGGSVLVVESISSDGATTHTAMDLRMLAIYGSREREVADIATLAADCGLRLTGVHLAGPSAIVHLTAP